MMITCYMFICYRSAHNTDSYLCMLNICGCKLRIFIREMKNKFLFDI